jgi:hypothetical protein
MHVRPYKAVRRLRKQPDDGPCAVATNAVSLMNLLGHAYLDQADRPRRKPTKDGAIRVIRTRSARYIRGAALAHLYDRARQEDPKSVLCRKLFKHIWKSGGLGAVAAAPPSEELLARFGAKQKDVKYVVLIVDYLLRSNAYPEDGIPSTIEDAKGFVWKWSSEYCVSKIARIWEDYKLVAPYLYALHLERSFRPTKIEGVDDILDWASTFVKSPRRIDRFLGHASFAMDVIKSFARDQRERDFVGVRRIKPPLRRFDDEEKLISASVDRKDPDYGGSFQDPE